MIDIDASLDAVSRQFAEGCVKTEEDLDRYRNVIKRTKPDVIIECGTFSGKSALWFARTAKCRVITIDTDPHIDPDTERAWADHDVRQLVGSSTAPDVIAHVTELALHPNGHDFSYPVEEKRPKVMVVLDSDHSAAHVLAEMHAYGPLVTTGCYMVVEDGLLRYMPDEERRHYKGDPLDAIEEWLAVHGDEWRADKRVEGLFPVTQFPSGWLRRR